jgi:LCP family protein required for cell wall assembly
MAAGDPDRPGPPEYKVYRSGSGRGRRSSSGSRKQREPASARGKGKSDAPEYNVYRSRSSPLARLRDSDVGAIRERLRRGRRSEKRREPRERPPWRRILKWSLIAAACWFLLSVVLFAVSAQIQKGKLADDAAAQLGGFPLLVASGQTILVIGTDARPEATGAAEAETRPKCIRQGQTGSPPSPDCSGFRADTLMLIRAGGGSFQKLSIPRDILANVPGVGPEKINSAYVRGGAALQIETVEGLLGIEIDHAVILDFQGFAEFIDAIGGVKINNPDRLRAIIDGGSGQGGITLKLDRGQHTLDGARALAYARARTNLRNPAEDDLDRARRQQRVLVGIRNRLTSPWRVPINFIRGPWIAWNAPKAMVSDMGAFTLPQLALSMAIAGGTDTRILGARGATPTPAGNLFIPQEECRRAVRRLIGEPPEETPPCSPAG